MLDTTLNDSLRLAALNTSLYEDVIQRAIPMRAGLRLLFSLHLRHLLLCFQLAWDCCYNGAWRKGRLRSTQTRCRVQSGWGHMSWLLGLGGGTETCKPQLVFH